MVVRPGYIVGPDDPTGRFTYWPMRFTRGGDVAVPGTPGDPVQIIDVRDLGAWLVRLAEDGAVGAFNACGPERRLSWGELMEHCSAAGKKGGLMTWVPAEFLSRHKEVEFPIWAPHEGATRGFHTWSNARAVAAGLRFRSVGETVKDTLRWYLTQEKLKDGRKELAGPSAAQEAALLSAWAKEREARG